MCDRCGVKVESTTGIYSGSFINQTGSDVRKFGGQICADCLDSIVRYADAKAQAITEGAEVISFTIVPIKTDPIVEAPDGQL
jgi:hypothetical protein